MVSPFYRKSIKLISMKGMKISMISYGTTVALCPLLIHGALGSFVIIVQIERI